MNRWDQHREDDARADQCEVRGVGDHHVVQVAAGEEHKQRKFCSNVLSGICHMMDESQRNAPGMLAAERIYVCASVYDIVSLSDLATASTRQLLLQPTIRAPKDLMCGQSLWCHRQLHEFQHPDRDRSLPAQLFHRLIQQRSNACPLHKFPRIQLQCFCLWQERGQ